MFSLIKAAIIDLDGTMLDTAPDFLLALNAMSAERSLPPIKLDTVKRLVGKGSEHLIRAALGLHLPEQLVKQNFDAALDSYQQHYRRINGSQSQLFPKIFEGLNAMRAMGLRLACVTNKPLAFALPLLESKGLAPYFDLVLGGDSLPRKKPDPMPILHVCHAFQLQAKQVVVIGDSANDAKAARGAACPVLLLPYGYNHGEAIQNVDCDGIVETLLDAAARLQHKTISTTP